MRERRVGNLGVTQKNISELRGCCGMCDRRIADLRSAELKAVELWQRAQVDDGLVVEARRVVNCQPLELGKPAGIHRSASGELNRVQLQRFEQRQIGELVNTCVGNMRRSQI